MKAFAVSAVSLLLLAALIACAVWVWPTRYRYDSVAWPAGGTTTARTDRFTGKVEVLTIWDWRTYHDTPSVPK